MKPFTHLTLAAAAFACATAAALPGLAIADLEPEGTEFQINTYTTYGQYNKFRASRSVAASGDGSFVVVWSSYQDGSGQGIVGQRFDAAGAKNGTEFVVNSYTTYYQYKPAVGAAADGRFVVVWHSYQDGSGYGIVGQRFDSTGAKDGSEFVVNSYTTYGQYYPDISVSTDGSFVVVWRGYDGDNTGVTGRRFDSSGAPAGTDFQVNSYTTDRQAYATVAAGDDSSFVVVWSSYQDGDGGSIHGQRFDSTGAPAGAEFQVNTYTTGAQFYPVIATPADGSFVVVWQSYGPDGDRYGIRGRRYDSGGSPNGDEFQVNAYTTQDQLHPTVAASSTGSFVVVWETSGLDGDGASIQARRFDETGTPDADEFQVNTYTTGQQAGSQSISTDGSGHYVVAWSSYGQDGDGYGMFGQRVCEDGNGDMACDAFAVCRSAPQNGCVEAVTAKMQYSEKVTGREKMKIQWNKLATATTQSDFGDPVGGDTAVAACIYDDADDLVVGFLIERGGADCGGRPCWKAKGTKGYGYKDKAATSAGIGKISLLAGDVEKGKASIAGKNIDSKGLTALPTGVAAGLTLNIAPTIQIIAGGGKCISAKINAVSKDDGFQYKAARIE